MPAQWDQKCKRIMFDLEDELYSSFSFNYVYELTMEEVFTKDVVRGVKLNFKISRQTVRKIFYNFDYLERYIYRKCMKLF